MDNCGDMMQMDTTVAAGVRGDNCNRIILGR